MWKNKVQFCLTREVVGSRNIGIWSLNGAWKNHLIPTAKRRGFLGIAGYYRRCIKNFDKISGSLNNHLKSNAFKWTSDAEVAFEGLKKALAEAPVIIESDASGYGIGAALMQDKGPIAYFSKMLHGKHLYLSLPTRKKWWPYCVACKGGRIIYLTEISSWGLFMLALSTSGNNKFLLQPNISGRSSCLVMTLQLSASQVGTITPLIPF